jgi:hypothetical protein
MNVRFKEIGALAAVSSLAVLAAVAVSQAAPPPVKMGLWQTEITTKTTTVEGNAGGEGAHVTIKQSCMTSESWTKDLLSVKNQENSECTQSNLNVDSHKLSYDESCKSDSYTTQVHFEMLVDGAEHMHGSASVKTTGPAFPQGMEMNMTLASRFLSSDCGDVQPGSEKTLQE